MKRTLTDKEAELRDSFAGLALSGLLAGGSELDYKHLVCDTLADAAYDLADAMIKRRRSLV